MEMNMNRNMDMDTDTGMDFDMGDRIALMLGWSDIVID
jgi:hypothetical protein